MWFLSLIAIAAGLHVASYGAYKDVPYEGFKLHGFLRELGLSLVSLSVLWNFPDARSAKWSVLFLSVVAVNRILTEGYKLFIREETQTKYAIPSQMHIGGRPVRPRQSRIALGLGYFGLIFQFFLLGEVLSRLVPESLRGVAVGLSVGAMMAAGGAYKDGFFEGFRLFKFFRSPVFSLFAGWYVSVFTMQPELLFLGTLGLERMLSEFYKTFVRNRERPGKFVAMVARYPAELRLRLRFVPIYLASWILFVAFVAFE